MTKRVLLFTSLTCGPCKTLKPEIERLSAERGFILDKFVLEDDRAPFSEHGVRVVPTLICVDDRNEVVDLIVGTVTPQALQTKLEGWGL